MWRGEIDGARIERGYETVEVGNADLAQDLRKQFDVPKPVSVDLATTIVPVVAIDLSDADGTGETEHHFLIGTDAPAGVGQFPWSIIQNIGQGTIVLEAVLISHLSGEVNITRTLQGAFVSDAAAVVHYTNTTPGSPSLSGVGRITGGGINAAKISLKLANIPSEQFHSLGDGYVLRPGELIALWGSANARMTAVWRGREFEK